MMELVSVVVPIYNVEQYLDRCIQSIQSQTYENLEIILVDDGSPDNCGKICDQYASKDQRVRVIHKKNGGLSDARNAGVKIATGKYLLFIDSDDFVAEDLVQKTVESAEEYHSDIVLFDYKRLESDGAVEICSMINIPENQGFYMKDFPQILFKAISACNKLFRKDFLEKSKIEFPVGYYYEDLGSSPKYLLVAERISYVKEPFYNYVIHEGSIMSATKEEKSYYDRCKMIERVISFYQQKQEYGKYFEELEFLALFHAYFIPAKEILFRKGDRAYIDKFRDFVREWYPEYSRNKYLKDMSKKEKLQFYMIDHKHYWGVNFMSWARKLISG